MDTTLNALSKHPAFLAPKNLELLPELAYYNLIYTSIQCCNVFWTLNANISLTASWNWNGSTPSGEVAEKKTEGEVSIQSKRGNTIKKAAQPNDPAIHLARPGNDVVKNQSELHVDERKSGDGEEAEEEEETTNKEAPKSDKKGEKRKAEDEAEGDGEGAKKARGRPKGAVGAAKKEKPEPKTKKEKAAKPATATNGEKKVRGRPKGTDSDKPAKEKKPKKERPEKPKAPATGIGKRTRSGGK